MGAAEREPGAQPAGSFADWSFRPGWRRYQQLGLDAFEADRAAGRERTLIVAPPGSGKTVMGLEIVRRLGAPALVLCPTQVIQGQWAQQQRRFGPPSDDLHVLTYQALCQAEDVDGLLRAAAERRWAGERAAATGRDAAQTLAESAAWTGAAAQRREREIARIVAAFTREAAHGRLPELGAAELLSASARARLDGLRAAGVAVVVLDECHHLISLWGALLHVVLQALAPAQVVGLTATNPRELTAEQAALYDRLLGPVDFSIPAPAVVREGHLAPYQELVQLCTPLASEQAWLADRHARFAAALADLQGAPAGHEQLGLEVWLLGRLVARRTAGGAQLSWGELARRRPAFAAAGLRWLHGIGQPTPDGAPHGEAFRAPLSIEDWATLLEDYALRCLGEDPSAEAAARLETIGAALGDLGYALTRRGVRRAGSEVDRVLLRSGAKQLAMCDALACESETRGATLRAVVLCDAEHPPRQLAAAPLLTGGARALLAAVARDERLAATRAAMVTGATFAVLPGDVGWWRERLGELGAAGRVTATIEDEIALLSGAGLTATRWVGWVTELLAAGEIEVLVGTRGLLGEGWDCPPVNVLVDMTAVAADVSVRQMRGRSLRLDPGDPGKLASNWDIVCVAPELGRGSADYGRFVRRHSHLHAPCEDGTIETGPSHVHPDLSPFAPPDAARFTAINAEQRDRAADREAARERWRLGEPYRGVDLEAIVVRGAVGGAAAARGRRGRAAGGAVCAGVFAPRRAWWRPAAWLRGPSLFPSELPLDWAAGVICAAYVALGELAAASAASLTFGVRPDGWVRVALPAASVAESGLVSAAIDELLGGGALPRYVVSRRARRPGWLPRTAVVWHPVPVDLGRRRDRADAFHAAWRRWSGSSQLVYARGDDPRGPALAALALGAGTRETQRRQIWQ